MALCRVADTVHTLHDCVHGGVVADSRVGAIEVVVDSAWQTDTAHIIFHGEVHGTSQRAVATNNHQCVDAFLAQVGISLVLSFVGHEFL